MYSKNGFSLVMLGDLQILPSHDTHPLVLPSDAEILLRELADVLHFGFISLLVRIVKCVFLKGSYRHDVSSIGKAGRTLSRS